MSIPTAGPTVSRSPARAAPRLPRLTPAVAVLVRRCGDVQVGWDPDRAVLIRPPDPRAAVSLATLLRAVDGVRTVDELGGLAVAAGLDPTELTELFDDLADVGLLHWGLPAGTGPRPLVHVHGRGPLTDALRDSLPLTGSRVTASHGSDLPLTELPSRAPVPALVLLTDDLVVDPCVVSELVATHTPHLHVRLRDGVGIVGPLVLPGRSSCLRCADLHRSDADPEWPSLAAQLLGRTGHGSAAAVRATAALALAQVEHLLRGPSSGEPEPGTLEATLELDVAGLSLQRRPWSPHPRCGCGAHP